MRLLLFLFLIVIVYVSLTSSKNQKNSKKVLVRSGSRTGSSSKNIGSKNKKDSQYPNQKYKVKKGKKKKKATKIIKSKLKSKHVLKVLLAGAVLYQVNKMTSRMMKVSSYSDDYISDRLGPDFIFYKNRRNLYLNIEDQWMYCLAVPRTLLAHNRSDILCRDQFRKKVTSRTNFYSPSFNGSTGLQLSNHSFDLCCTNSANSFLSPSFLFAFTPLFSLFNNFLNLS